MKSRIVAESYATSVGDTADRYGLAKNQLFGWRRDARLAGGSGMTFAPVMVDDAAKDSRPEAGRIEIELGATRVRIERGADVGLAVAVIGALRGGR